MPKIHVLQCCHCLSNIPYNLCPVTLAADTPHWNEMSMFNYKWEKCVVKYVNKVNSPLRRKMYEKVNHLGTQYLHEPTLCFHLSSWPLPKCYSASSSVVTLQFLLSTSLPRWPWGFHLEACFCMVKESLLGARPIHVNFRRLICPANGLSNALLCDSSWEITLIQKRLNIFPRHLFMSVQILCDYLSNPPRFGPIKKSNLVLLLKNFNFAVIDTSLAFCTW